ncbi:hypothetical protein V8E36_000354 [Tilletia maclaganii]
MTSSPPDSPSAQQHEKTSSSPNSPTATLPCAQPRKAGATSMISDDSPARFDKILETTDEERALATFSFRAPAFLSNAKPSIDRPTDTPRSTSNESSSRQFFRAPLRPLTFANADPDRTESRDASSTSIPTQHVSNPIATARPSASENEPPTPCVGVQQALGQKRNAEVASLSPFFSRTGSLSKTALAKRHRPSSPLISPATKGNQSIKDLLSSRSASVRFQPLVQNKPQGLFSSATSGTPAFQALLSDQDLGTVADDVLSGSTTFPTPNNSFGMSRQLPDSDDSDMAPPSKEVGAAPSSPRSDVTEMFEPLSDHADVEMPETAAESQHDEPVTATAVPDPHGSIQPENSMGLPARNHAASDINDAAAAAEQKSAVPDKEAPPLSSNVMEEASKLGSLTADADLSDVWSWLVRQRQRMTDLVAHIEIKDAEIASLASIKAEKEHELERARVRSDELVSQIGQQNKDLSDFREALDKQKLDNDERNKLLEERTRELMQFQENMALTLKRDDEEQARLQNEISHAREQLSELRAQRDAGTEMIKQTKDRLEQALFDLAESRDQAKTLEKHKTELVDTVLRLEKETSELGQKSRDLERVAAEHEEMKLERQAAQERLESELRAHTQRVDELRAAEASLTSEKERLAERLTALDSEVRAARQSQADASQQNGTLQIQLAQSTEKCAGFETQIKELSGCVERLGLAAKERDEQLRTCDKEKAEAQIHCAELQQNLQATERSLMDVQNELKGLKEQNVVLQSRLERINQEAAEQATAAADAQRDKTIAEAAHESCRQTLEELRDVRKALQHQLEEKERQLNEYLKLTRDGSTMSMTELAKLQGKYEIASERMAAMSQQLFDSETRKTALMTELAQLKESVRHGQRENEAIRTREVAALQDACTKLEAEKVELNTTILMLNEEIEHLKEQLHEAKEDVDLRSVEAEEGRRAIEQQKTLMTRYQAGQLTEAETQLLAQAIASNAEQVAREISKRDNIIKGLEYEKRSFLDKLKKSQQEIESMRKGAASRRSIPLPTSEPSSEADASAQNATGRVRFVGIERIQATAHTRSSAGTSMRPPSTAGHAKPTRQYTASRSASSRHASSSSRPSVASSALQALSQTRDDDEVSNDADTARDLDIVETSAESMQDGFASLQSRRSSRKGVRTN